MFNAHKNVRTEEDIMAGNRSLGAARLAKEDEFYTQLTDVEKEMRHYRKHFRDKTVFCNCDDPFESNFFKYFVLNFNRLGLKKLIATCYASSPVANTQLSLFNITGKEEGKQNKAYKAIVTSVYDKTGDGGIDMFDVAELFKTGENELTELESDGDFRSDECLKLLKEADIVVTNPPFSLFREYIAVLQDYDKHFIIIGNQNAITYKEIFPLLRDNKIWLGDKSGDMAFMVPEYYEARETRYWEDEAGQKWRSLGNICWFTNLDIKKRHEELILVKRYDPELHLKYVNYDAINVDKVSDIPFDYVGVMGVPITFMDKYNPDQFEILGTSDNGIVPDKYKTTPGLTQKFVDDYYSAGGKGSYKEGNPTAGVYKNGVATMIYKRIFIRNKHPEGVK